MTAILGDVSNSRACVVDKHAIALAPLQCYVAKRAAIVGECPAFKV